MDGINRDFSQQAIELRIQIEEAKLGRELSIEERKAITDLVMKDQQQRVAVNAR